MTDINTAALRRAIEETPPREWGDVLSREELLALLDELDSLRERVEKLEAVLRRWESYGCPNCGGDCSSVNPPVSSCIMKETRCVLENSR